VCDLVSLVCVIWCVLCVWLGLFCVCDQVSFVCVIRCPLCV